MIRETMQEKTTEELLAMHKANDTEEWSPEALEIMREVLIERGALPAEPNDGPGAGKAFTSESAAPTMRRYTDAYLVARVAVDIGGVIKAIGILVAGMILVGGFVGSSEASGNMVFLFGGLILAVVVGVPFYVLGVLVSAIGQILRASLDTAVTSSPFLTRDQMFRVMS